MSKVIKPMKCEKCGDYTRAAGCCERPICTGCYVDLLCVCSKPSEEVCPTCKEVCTGRARCESCPNIICVYAVEEGEGRCDECLAHPLTQKDPLPSLKSARIEPLKEIHADAKCDRCEDPANGFCTGCQTFACLGCFRGIRCHCNHTQDINLGCPKCGSGVLFRCHDCYNVMCEDCEGDRKVKRACIECNKKYPSESWKTSFMFLPFSLSGAFCRHKGKGADAEGICSGCHTFTCHECFLGIECGCELDMEPCEKCNTDSDLARCENCNHVFCKKCTDGDGRLSKSKCPECNVEPPSKRQKLTVVTFTKDE